MIDIRQSALELIGETPLLQLDGYSKKREKSNWCIIL